MRRPAALIVGLALLAVASVASPALAATAATSSATPPIANVVGDLLGGIANTVLGGVDWTVNVAGDFLMNLLGGVVQKLIPRSWIDKGLDIMTWLVAVPDYTARVTAPGGGRTYGFAGVNEMRGLYLWLGMAIAPLTLVYATSKSWSGQGDPPHVPLSRVLMVAIALLNYAWLWSQAVALSNQVTHAILGVAAVTSGVQKMFEVLIAGAGLVGLPLVGLLLMAAGGLQLLVMLFVKVTLILIGALVYATGPLMIGLVATEYGNAAARTWLTLALGLFLLPIMWASSFALAAVLINDARTGASVIGGSSGLGETLGGLLIAMAAIAAFWLNIKLTKGFAGIAGAQLAGLLALAAGGALTLLGGRGGGGAGAGASTAAAVAPAGGGVASLRTFASKAGAGAASALAGAGPGAALAGAGAVPRGGGLPGATGTLASTGTAAAAGGSARRAAASSRAGSVAARAARAARRGARPEPGPSEPASPGPPAAPTPTVDETDRPPADAPRPSAPPRPSQRRAPSSATTPDSGQAGEERDSPPVSSPPVRPARSRRRTSRRSSSTPAPADNTPTGDHANDAAHAAFGQPTAPKPRRSVRPFRKGPRA